MQEQLPQFQVNTLQHNGNQVIKRGKFKLTKALWKLWQEVLRAKPVFCTRKNGHSYLTDGCSVFDIAYAVPTSLYSPYGAQSIWGTYTSNSLRITIRHS